MDIKDVSDTKFAVKNVSFDIKNDVSPSFKIEVDYLGDTYDALNALPKLIRDISKIKPAPVKQKISPELKDGLNEFALELLKSKFSKSNKRTADIRPKAISRIRHRKRNSRSKKKETVIMNMAGDILGKVGG
ncbi:MAG: hypothetical protein ABF690_11815 [Liquorilactobacillus nagelii]|uniref:hypothetical protein n=1 Tax=Lactobacillaceae TaxID=33958 RepID=UPI0039E7835D